MTIVISNTIWYILEHSFCQPQKNDLRIGYDINRFEQQETGAYDRVMII
jgi:hypothetical protein